MQSCARFRDGRWSGPRHVALIGLVPLFCLAGCDRPVPRTEIADRLARIERPNLVLIVVDTLRADWTSPYGFEHDTTPELSRWAEQGVLFERARAQSSWTKMSMASLLTSLWPRTHAIREPDDGLADQALTLAEVFHEAGYGTYAVQTNGWLHPSFGFHQGFDHYVFPIGRGARGLPKSALWPHADRVYEEFVRIVDAHDRDRPFFLYLHLMDVHQYGAPNEFKRFGTDDRGAYLAAIRWVDDMLERVREKLEDSGHLANTIIVLASDHGEEFGEHGITGHARNVLTPVLHVPLVIRFPFRVEGIRVALRVRNLDIAPTALELAHLTVPEGFEGRSLLPLVFDSPLPDDDSTDRASFAALGSPLYLDARVQESVNDGSWTYARDTESSRPESRFLFDRSVDPNEQVNLVRMETRQAARLGALLERHRRQPPSRGVQARNVRIDPDIAQRLRAMGYLK